MDSSVIKKSMENTRCCYSAKPLLQGEQTIRLLTLDRTEDGVIQAGLTVVDISDASKIPSWTALSYTWASNRDTRYIKSHPDDDDHNIMLEGREYAVKHNLWLALNALIDLREADRHRSAGMRPDQSAFGCFAEITPARFWHYFWIDAICIDQTTILERNHQVGMMKQIFSNADLVVAWLAPAIGRYTTVASELVHNPFWSRMWIVQEIVLARQLVILSKDSTCLSEQKYHELYDWAFEESVHGRNDARVLNLRDKYRRIKQAEKLARDSLDLVDNLKWRLHGIESRPDLPDLLSIFSESECQDNRDKVYALLGLLPGDYPIKADYSLSAQELFMNLAHVERDAVWDAGQWEQALGLKLNWEFGGVQPWIRRFKSRLRVEALDKDLDDSLMVDLYIDYYKAEQDPMTIQVMRKSLSPRQFLVWLLEERRTREELQQAPKQSIIDKAHPEHSEDTYFGNDSDSDSDSDAELLQARFAKRSKGVTVEFAW